MKVDWKKYRKSGAMRLGVLLLVIAAGLCVTVSRSSASVVLAVRHLLMTVDEVTHGGTTAMANGEIAYDPAQGKVVAQLNGSRVSFPQDPVVSGNPTFAYSTMRITKPTDPNPSVVLKSGSVFRMSDGSVRKLNADLIFSISNIHASTAFANGWNYLYLQTISGSDSILVSPSFGNPSKLPGVYAYVGSAFATVTAGNPLVDSIFRLGNQTFHRQVIADSKAGFGGEIALNLPVSATLAHISVWGNPTTPGDLVDFQVCERIATSSPNQPDGMCNQQKMDVGRDSSGAFSILVSNPSMNTLSFEVLGYSETLDSLR